MPSWIKVHMGWLLGIFILIVLCAFLLYSWVNTLVSLDYAHQEQKYQRQEIKVLQNLLLETGKRMSRSEIEELVLKQFGKDHLIKKEEKDELSIDNVIFKFKGDSIIEVRSPTAG